MKKLFTLFLLLLMLHFNKVSNGQGQVFVSSDPDPSFFSIEARARYGNTGYEAVLFTPENPSPVGLQLNPAGIPAWLYGAQYTFEFTYDQISGISTWKIDFNRDGDFDDAQESVSSISPTLVGKGFKYVNLYIQSNISTGTISYIGLHNLTINGTNFGTLSSPSNGNALEHLYENSAGLFTEIVVTGTLMMTGSHSQERPRLWIRAGCPINVQNWTGTVNSDWNTPGNWAGNNVPSSTVDVLIPFGSSAPILSAGNVYNCNNLIVAAGSGVKSAPLSSGLIVNGQLNVSGNLTITPTGSIDIPAQGALIINKDLYSDGNFLIEDNGSLITYGSTSGTARFERYIASNMAWHLISSPVSGQAICNGVFAPTFPGAFPGNISTWDFYNWAPNCPTPPDPPQHWRNLRTSSGSVNTVDFPGLAFWVSRGYLVAYGAGWPTTKSFVGTPNCCTTVCTFYDIDEACSWALPGNPFPSSVDWNLVTDKYNLQSDYYYIWNENKAGGPGYEYWKDVTHKSSSMVDGYIPAMQGFFVKVDPNMDLFLTIPNSARSLHNSAWLKEKDTPVNKLSITLDNGTNSDEAIVMFENNSCAGKDRSDAEKLFSLNSSIPQVYTIIDNDQKTSLNSLPYVTNGATIPIGFVAPVKGNYSITVSGIESFSSLAGLTLEDLQLNDTQNLLQNPVYHFTAGGNEDAGRFLLHIAGPISICEKDGNTLNIFSNEKNVFISCNAGFRNSKVTVSNLLGQEILTQKMSDQKMNLVKVNAPKGYYIVKVQNESSVQTAKVYIN